MNLQLSEGYAVAASSYTLSGWALFNSAEDLELLLDEAGQALATVSSTLEPEGRTSMFVTEHFPGLIASGFKGTVLVEAVNGRFAMIALELGAQPGEFTTLPVTTVP